MYHFLSFSISRVIQCQIYTFLLVLMFWNNFALCVYSLSLLLFLLFLSFLCFYILSGVNMTLIQVVLIFYNISFFYVRLYHFQVNCNRKSDLNTLYILNFQRLCNRNLVPNKNRHAEYPSHQEEKVLPVFQIHSVLYTIEKTMLLINCHSCHKVEGSFDSFMNI